VGDRRFLAVMSPTLQFTGIVPPSFTSALTRLYLAIDRLNLVIYRRFDTMAAALKFGRTTYVDIYMGEVLSLGPCV